MTNYSAGHDAEKHAADYLKKRGYKIKELNWKTRYCEIDIIAEKQKIIWFIEVKSRKNSSQGFGYEYVTSTKLRQMQFAAEMWVQENSWSEDCRLAVVSVDAGDFTLIDDIA